MITRLILTIGFFTIYLLCTYTAWYLTEKRTIEPFSYLDRYPFKCKKCFSFWLLLFSYISVGYIIGSLWFAILGAILTIMNALADIYTDKKRY